MNYAGCTSQSNQSLIVLREADTKLTVHNPERIPHECIKVDGCLITDQNVKKCDLILKVKINNDLRAAYIELKGAHCKITDAVEQLKATIATTRSNFPAHTMAAYVVGGVFPQSGSTPQKLRTDFARENRMPLFTKSRGDSLNLVRLCVTS